MHLRTVPSVPGICLAASRFLCLAVCNVPWRFVCVSVCLAHRLLFLQGRSGAVPSGTGQVLSFQGDMVESSVGMVTAVAKEPYNLFPKCCSHCTQGRGAILLDGLHVC